MTRLLVVLPGRNSSLLLQLNYPRTQMRNIYKCSTALLLQLAILNPHSLLAQSEAVVPGAETSVKVLKGLDIGNVGKPGSTTFDKANGKYAVSGSGEDIFGKRDQFHFAYRSWSGDGEITARVMEVPRTHNHAKAGVMFRESLDADSANVVMEILANAGAEFQYRQNTGAKTSYKVTKKIKAPHYVRLIRVGDTFTGYRSSDGTAWTLQGSVTVPMKQGIYLGLSVTAHNNEVLNTAIFDNVTISSKTSPLPRTQDTPAASNDTKK